MEARLDCRGSVAASSGIGVDARGSWVEPHALHVGGDFEGQLCGMISDHIAWEYRIVHARSDAVEIDEWPVLLHRGAHRDIGPRLTVFALVAVHEKIGVRCDLVVVGWFLAGLGRCRGDREGGARGRELLGSPNTPATAPELDRLSGDIEAGVEVIVGDDAASGPLQFLEAGEGCEAELPIEVGHSRRASTRSGTSGHPVPNPPRGEPRLACRAERVGRGHPSFRTGPRTPRSRPATPAPG